MAPTSLHQLMTIGVTFLLLNTITPTNSGGAVNKCEEKKEFSECGAACVPTCSQYDPPPACTKKCVPGCVCKKGFLVDDSGQCIPRKMCISCKGNTTYTSCGTACPKTCNNMYDTGVKPCNLMCLIGCVCKPRYVLLNDKKKKCVLPKDCPKKKPKQ